MLRLLSKRERAVSPIVATMLIISITLAAASIVMLVVMPMLNPTPVPELVLLGNESFKDYDNDGDCDFMELQLTSLTSGADANISHVIMKHVLGENSQETTWVPFSSYSAIITMGSTKNVNFIAQTDDLDEIPDGASISFTVISNGENVEVIVVPDTILVELGDPVQVEFKDGSNNPIEGGRINFYKSSGEFAYSGQVTDASGMSVTYLFPGRYYVRASDGFSLYYSDSFYHPGEGLIQVAVQGGLLTVMVKSGTTPVEGTHAYVYDTTGHYLNKEGVTGADGIVTFSLENGLYKIRAEVAGITYYSSDINFPNTSYVEIDIGGGDIYCRVIDGGDNPISNTRVYLFRATGSYYGKSGITNDTGMAEFTAVPGETLFKFRVDYLSYRLWSQEFGASPGAVIDVNVGGGTIFVNVTDGSGLPIENVRTYLFTQSGSYSGIYANTNTSGIAEYNKIAGGFFKIRINYLAQRFWSPVFFATDGYVVQASIGGGTLYGLITSGTTPVTNTRVYLFTESGSYTGKYGDTNTSGIVEMQGIGEGNYKMRVNYLSKRYWSPVFFFNETATVPYDLGGGTVYANVTAGGTPISGVRVYAFTPSGSYSGVYADTNTSGIAEFTSLGGGDFKFRVNYLARRFWSDVFTAADGIVVDVDLGGGTINVHLFNNYNYNISGARIYLFTETGSYTGKYADTDANGIATFTGIGEANYKFRANYLAKRFWSAVFLATPDLNFDFNIGGGIVYLHVFDGSGTDIDGPRAYLFTSSGSYTGFYANLNSSGLLECPRIGDGMYKWRVDYLGKRFWSPEFDAINETTLEFNIGGGTIYVHLTVDGVDVDNGHVYLYTSTGSYTGKHGYTNSSGWVEFYGIGDGDYRLRYNPGTGYEYHYFTASADLVLEFAILTGFMPVFMVATAPKK